VGLASRALVALAALGLAGAQASPAAAQAGPPHPGPAPSPIWVGPDGEPLPFTDDASVVEFLRTARVVETKTIPQGINQPERLVLEKDGVRARAAFRVADIERKDAQVGDRFFLRFRDSCHHEPAAYALAQALGIRSIPPTTQRRLQGRSGSIQLWIEGARDTVGFKPRDVSGWIRQVWDKDLFDNLILNIDRNSGNMLVGPEERLWLIDHTRAFQPVPELLDPEALRRVNREAWTHILALTEEDMKEMLGTCLDAGQLGALAKRRDLLVEHVERLVAERGEDLVFY
jgi:hypothetical protein